MNPPDDELQPWSIAKSEWDSVVVRTDRALRMMRWGGIISVVIAVGACIAAFLVPKSLVIAMLVVGGVAVYHAVLAAIAGDPNPTPLQSLSKHHTVYRI